MTVNLKDYAKSLKEKYKEPDRCALVYKDGEYKLALGDSSGTIIMNIMCDVSSDMSNYDIVSILEPSVGIEIRNKLTGIPFSTRHGIRPKCGKVLPENKE